MKSVVLTIFVLSIAFFSLGSIWLTYKKDKEKERRRKDDVD
jgi:hypothetical protein